MPRSFPAAVAALLVLIAGCSRPAPKPFSGLPVIDGPHGHTPVFLPDDLGYVEVWAEPYEAAPPAEDEKPAAKKARAKAKKSSRPTVLVIAYFLKPDGKTPMNPAKARMTVAMPDGGEKAANLVLYPDAEDKATAGRHVSDTEFEGIHELIGTITASLDGKEVAIPISIR